MPLSDASPTVPGDATAALRDLCERVRDAVAADDVSLWVIDDTEGSLRPFATTRRDIDSEAASRWSRIDLERFPLVGSEVADGGPVVVDDPQEDPRLPGGLATDLRSRPFEVHRLPTVAYRTLLAVEPPQGSSGALDGLRPVVAATVDAILARREAERRSRQAEILTSLLRATGDGSYRETLATVCQQLAVHLGVRRTTLFVLDHGQQATVMSQFADGVPRPEALERLEHASGLPPLVQRVIDTREPVTATRDELDRWWADTFDLGAILAVPVGHQQVTGVVVLDTPQQRSFTTEQVTFTSTVGLGLGEVLARARAWEQQGEDLQAATAVSRLLGSGVTARTVDEAAATLSASVREAFATELAAVALVGPEGRVDAIRTSGVPADIAAALDRVVVGAPATTFPWGRPPPDSAAARGPLLVSDTAAEDPSPDGLVETLQLRAYAALPITARDRLLGVVVCGDRGHPRRWRPADGRLAERLAAEASLVVENVTLRQTEQAQNAMLAEHARLLDIVAASARDLNVLDASSLDENVAETAARLGFDRVALGLFEPDRYKVVVSRGAAVDIGASYPLGGLVEQVASGGTSVRGVDDVLVRGVGTDDHQVLAAPVRMDGRRVGGVLVVARRGDPPRAHEVRAVELLASHAGRALANNQRFADTRTSVERLLALEERTGDLLARVSHELRTPLTVVQGMARTLNVHWSRLDDTARADLLRRLAANADQLQEVVGRLLDLTRAEQGKLAFQPRPLDLAQTAIATTERLADLLREHDVTAESTPGCLAQGDPVLIERVVENLLTNSVRHTPAGSEVVVRVTASPATGDVEFAVIDRGPGMTPEHLERIGQKFFQAGDDRRGLGVGLALVSEILRLHGTHLDVTSELGHGSTFSFHLAPAKTPSR